MYFNLSRNDNNFGTNRNSDVIDHKICSKYKLFLEKFNNKDAINNSKAYKTQRLKPIFRKSKSCIDIMK